MTSRTSLSTYEGLGVTELWRRKDKQLQLYRLQQGRYVEVETSPTFPNLSLGRVGWIMVLRQERA